jgi:hypothetical protein
MQFCRLYAVQSRFSNHCSIDSGKAIFNEHLFAPLDDFSFNNIKSFKKWKYTIAYFFEVNIKILTFLSSKSIESLNETVKEPCCLSVQKNNNQPTAS